MNSITNKKNNEGGETEETMIESLNEGLLKIFDKHNKGNTFKCIRTNDILEEAHRQTERMEEEQLDDHAFHELYESMKYSLGSYFSASVGMMMAFGILTAKEKVEMRTLLLLQKIEDKYKLRPLMKEVKSLAYWIRSKRMNHHLQPIIINVGRKESVMEDNKNDDVLRGLFEGGNFPNAQINVVTGDGVQISYESAQAKTVHDDDDGQEQGKAAIMEYVGRLKPLVVSDFIEKYDEVWLRVLDLDEVKSVVYDRGRQQNTTFNRNFVANIIHLMSDNGMYLLGTTDVTMAKHLEPQKGKDHPVRGCLGLSPENKVKKAIEKVFQEYLRESS